MRANRAATERIVQEIAPMRPDGAAPRGGLGELGRLVLAEALRRAAAHKPGAAREATSDGNASILRIVREDRA